MSTPQPGRSNSTQLPDTSLQLTRPVGATEITGLHYEFFETIRKILQHTVFALLLAIRLYMLPLLFISYKLSAHDDPWYPAIWNLVLLPGRALADVNRCRQRNSSTKIGKTWTSIRDGIFAPYKIFRSLYSLGKMIGEDPNSLQPNLFPQPDPTTGSGIDDQNKDEDSAGDQSAESTGSPLKAPASASQIYHAALLSGSTLDDMLAAFETDGDSRTVGFNRVVIRRDPKACLSVEQLDAMSQWKRQRYRTSSVRSTSEAVLGAGKAGESFPSRVIHSGPRDCQQPKMPDRQASVRRVQLQGEPQADNPLPKNNPGSPTSTRTCHPPETPQPDGHVNSSALDRCPTFVRRHAQSRLPRRSVTGDKRALAMLKERGAMSTPVLPVSPPTLPPKRLRLQRRVRPKTGVLKVSND
ncbi:uncharacterized protein Z519_04772 [Cladophialophora bantiana CBS 173.52]|uniref:Uncharacterized protein n=1 Tax=Cladophialophora bantiana (strain ATCC 10958 / CBS 173.52 / CDC B-1940 / NIH 8579) TaxID=1442370 RepID=A0A0D2HV96_CLAB1|nr:uncharacterized protein Z519_04772 [Cladophialophora bantiana CBS 173.52]KIW94795.1 hypothetical protein Z519_04772 [Cladophialophora bantiana CBS 173.52]